MWMEVGYAIRHMSLYRCLHCSRIFGRNVMCGYFI